MDPRRFLVVPLVALYLFAAFVVAAVLKRRDAQSHKRLMLLATIALLPPAIARWALLLGLGPPLILTLSALVVIPIVVWDRKTRQSLHPVTLWGGLILLLSIPLRFVVAQSSTWPGIADWLVGWVK